LCLYNANNPITDAVVEPQKESLQYVDGEITAEEALMDDNSFKGATEALGVPSPSNKEGTSSEPPSPSNEHQSKYENTKTIHRGNLSSASMIKPLCYVLFLLL